MAQSEVKENGEEGWSGGGYKMEDDTQHLIEVKCIHCAGTTFKFSTALLMFTGVVDSVCEDCGVITRIELDEGSITISSRR